MCFGGDSTWRSVTRLFWAVRRILLFSDFFVRKNEDTVLQNRDILNDREIRIIQEFIKQNYQEMYLKWAEYSSEGFYKVFISTEKDNDIEFIICYFDENKQERLFAVWRNEDASPKLRENPELH